MFMGDWKKSWLKNLSDIDKIRDELKVGSGFGKKIENWVDCDLVYFINVFYLLIECLNRSYSVVFFEDLFFWFIKLFIKLGDIVLDFFFGFGMIVKVVRDLGWIGLGIELLEEYCEVSVERLFLFKYLING